MATYGCTNLEYLEVEVAVQPPGAHVEGAPVWTSSRPDLFTVEPDETGLGGKIVSVDGAIAEPPDNQSEIVIAGDADLGEGVIPVSLSFFAELLPLSATGFGVTVIARPKVPA